MVLIKKASKVQKSFVLQIAFFSLKFVGTIFVSSTSIISSHRFTESSVMLAKYLPFLQIDVAELQI